MKDFVRFWTRQLDEHELLTYASAISFQTLTALAPLSLLLRTIQASPATSICGSTTSRRRSGRLWPRGTRGSRGAEAR